MERHSTWPMLGIQGRTDRRLDGQAELSPLADSRRFPSGLCSWRWATAAGVGGANERGEKEMKTMREYVRNVLLGEQRDWGSRGGGWEGAADAQRGGQGEGTLKNDRPDAGACLAG